MTDSLETSVEDKDPEKIVVKLQTKEAHSKKEYSIYKVKFKVVIFENTKFLPEHASAIVICHHWVSNLGICHHRRVC